MKKWIIYGSIAVLTIGLILCTSIIVVLYNRLNIEMDKIDKITEAKESNEVLTTSYSGTRISPNAELIFTTYYKVCGDTVTKKEKVDESLVNKNEYELTEYYRDWDVKKFSANEVILYKEEDSMCGEDYVIKDVNGCICIMQIDKDGKEKLYKKTDIEIQYLPEVDRDRLR